MRNEKDLVSIFSMIVLIFVFAAFFPEKVSEFFDETLYLFIGGLVLFMLIFYFWLRLRNY